MKLNNAPCCGALLPPNTGGASQYALLKTHLPVCPTPEGLVKVLNDYEEAFSLPRTTLPQPAPLPIPDPEEPMERVRQQINRYFVGLYGEDYTYRAPETFSNQLEVWMLLVCSGDITAADEQMERLERMIEEGKRR